MDIFIGIDQTGATRSQGKRAKGLPMCLAVKQKSGTWQFLTEQGSSPLVLEQFHPQLLVQKLEALGVRTVNRKIAVILDCVLGLPREVPLKPTKVKPYLWSYFEAAARFSKEGKEFGREVAEAFFEEIFKASGKVYPKRFCETVSGSNSVFQVRPYQKNIQTGTFRLWKDLGSVGEPWAHIWPFESKNSGSHSIWIFEGYPSLIWRECLQSPNRNTKELQRLTQQASLRFEIDTWRHLEKSPDQADSFVLAWAGVFLQEQKRLWIPSKSFSKDPNAPREGWLLGLKHPNDN